MFPSWSWLEWRGDLVFSYWKQKSFKGEEIGMGKHVSTRPRMTEIKALASVSFVEGNDNKIRLQTQVHLFTIRPRVPGPPKYGDPDTSDHFLSHQDGSAIRPPGEDGLSFDWDIIPLLLSDRPELLATLPELALLVRMTGIDYYHQRWNRVLPMLIRRREDGTAERLAIVILSGDDWNHAPATTDHADISLV